MQHPVDNRTHTDTHKQSKHTVQGTSLYFTLLRLCQTNQSSDVWDNSQKSIIFPAKRNFRNKLSMTKKQTLHHTNKTNVFFQIIQTLHLSQRAKRVLGSLLCRTSLKRRAVLWRSKVSSWLHSCQSPPLSQQHSLRSLWLGMGWESGWVSSG